MADSDWKFGDWDGRASLYSPTAGHACLDGKTWTAFHPADVSDAKVMTRDAFEAAFPGLPPYPTFRGSAPKGGDLA